MGPLGASLLVAYASPTIVSVSGCSPGPAGSTINCPVDGTPTVLTISGANYGSSSPLLFPCALHTMTPTHVQCLTSSFVGRTRVSRKREAGRVLQQCFTRVCVHAQ